jgi:hypothetical protein
MGSCGALLHKNTHACTAFFFDFCIRRLTMVHIRCITRVDQQLALDLHNAESLELRMKMYTMHPPVSSQPSASALCPSLPVYVCRSCSRVRRVSRSIWVSSLPSLPPYERVAVDSVVPVSLRCRPLRCVSFPLICASVGFLNSFPATFSQMNDNAQHV